MSKLTRVLGRSMKLTPDRWSFEVNTLREHFRGVYAHKSVRIEIEALRCATAPFPMDTHVKATVRYTVEDRHVATVSLRNREARAIIRTIEEGMAAKRRYRDKMQRTDKDAIIGELRAETNAARTKRKITPLGLFAFGVFAWVTLFAVLVLSR